MKRFFVIISVILPGLLLLFFRLFPELDPPLHQPLLHFYLVTFFTFTALVAAAFTAVALGDDSAARHQLLAMAFAAMAVLFFMHGVTTPQAIIFTTNPGIRWAAWLTMFVGGLIFALAGLDRPQRPLKLRQRHLIQWVLVLFCGSFVLIVIFWPGLLAAIDEQADPWHRQLVFWSTITLWLSATVMLTRTWRQTHNRVDGVMALTAVWFLWGSISLHQFPPFQLSWWLYHVLLLLGVSTAVVVLVQEYEQLRRFSLTYYYAAIGLIVVAAVSLAASYLFSQMVEINLAPQIDPTLMTQMVVQARLNGLLIAASATGLVYAVMLMVVNRADRLIMERNTELATAYANLQAAEAMRDDLTDMVVHDLRSPLTSINLSLQLLNNPKTTPEKQVDLIGRSQTAVQRMMTLINQLLDVARLESGQLQLTTQATAIPALLQEKLSQFGAQAESEHKQIQIDAAANLPVVWVEPELIGRVLDNLIGNALKYTEAGGVIMLRAEANGAYLQLQVQDDGEGIDPEAAARIFDKFYQVKDTDGKPIRRGTGLGLTFCKLVVEAHNGRIWVESQPQQGSTFCFTLPLPPPLPA